MKNSNASTFVLDHATCYRALCAKDSRFNGEFFVGVSTTGIYCRPVCRVKTPRASSCTFYPNASAAEAAGFRPCLRCRPELAPYALQQNLAYAVWQRIAAGALNGCDTMQELARLVGLSARQLQRLMQTHFGVSPIELAQTTRLLFAKKPLPRGRQQRRADRICWGIGAEELFVDAGRRNCLNVLPQLLHI